jgi:hypothetical protein
MTILNVARPGVFQVLFRKRQRKALAPVILASWVFAILVSIANACGLVGDVARPKQSETATIPGHEVPDSGAPLACIQFCSDDFPVLGKIKAIQDPPTGAPLIVADLFGDPMQTVAATFSSLEPRLHPPPAIAVNIRFVRLAL